MIRRSGDLLAVWAPRSAHDASPVSFEENGRAYPVGAPYPHVRIVGQGEEMVAFRVPCDKRDDILMRDDYARDSRLVRCNPNK